jgi:hypothetical protein
MVKVDDVGVLVLKRGVTVSVAMRLLPLPALVSMAMVLVVHVHMLVVRGHMKVLDLAGVVSRPQGQRAGCRG